MSCTWRAGAPGRPGPSIGCPERGLIRREKSGNESWGWLGVGPSSQVCFVSGSQAARADKAPELVMDEHVKSFATCKLLCNLAVSLPFTLGEL